MSTVGIITLMVAATANFMEKTLKTKDSVWKNTIFKISKVKNYFLRFLVIKTENSTLFLTASHKKHSVQKSV